MKLPTAFARRSKSATTSKFRNFRCFSISSDLTADFFAYILKDGKAQIVATPYVVLATGGIGQVYRYTKNSAIATGDGIRLAYDLGCKIAHLDYVQFHPTSFAADKTSRQKFLISEAVRGEGAYLLNCHKERFMHLLMTSVPSLPPRRGGKVDNS